MPTTYMTVTHSKIKPILIAILLLLALLIRLAPVFSDTIHFSFDQGLDMILVKDLVADHHIALTSRYSGLQGVLMGPVWTWFLAIGFILTGGSPGGGVIMLSLLSVGGALLTYILFRKIIGETASFITLLFLLFFPVFVGFSKVVLSPYALVYIFFLFIWLSYQIFVEKKTKFYPWLGLLMGLFFQFEIAFAVFVPPILLVYFLIFRSKKLIDIKNIIFAIILFGLTFVPQLIFDLRNQFLISNSLISFLNGTNNNLYTHSLPLDERIFSRLATFNEDILAMAFFISPPILAVISMIIAAIGWILIIKSKQKNLISMLVLLLGIVVTFFIGFTIYKGPLWGWYRSGLPIVYLFLLTIPLGFFWNKNLTGKIVSGILVFIFLWQSFSVINITDFTYKAQGGNLVNSQKEIIDYIYKDAGGKEFSYFAYTPPLYDYLWQYEFWWHGNDKFGTTPKNLSVGIPILGVGTPPAVPSENDGLTYLIVEPNTERKWEPLEFVKKHLRYGKEISRKVFPSGLMVVKLNTEK